MTIVKKPAGILEGYKPKGMSSTRIDHGALPGHRGRGNYPCKVEGRKQQTGGHGH